MPPLTSLKILDFTTLLPGPFATMYLADLGADILRIEAPNRPDIVRLSPPFVEDGISAAHATLNRSKRSMVLNLKHPDGVKIVKRLVHEYDIVIEQFRPNVMNRLGVDYEVLSAENPQLIYCAITGFGQTGGLANRAGHDMSYLALSGLMSHSGRKETGPTPQGTQIADIGGGSLSAVIGILAAVIHRQQTGEGQFLDISMTDGAMALNAVAGAEYLAGGKLPDYENMLLNGGSQYNYYRTADNRYLAVSPLEPKFWHEFCHVIERPDLIGQLTTSGEAMKPVQDAITSILVTKTLDEWVAIFSQHDVCVEPVLNLDEVVAHSQTKARDMVVEVSGEGGSVQQFANPIKFSKTPPSYRHYGVKAGADTKEVLTNLGYTTSEIKVLYDQGTVS